MRAHAHVYFYEKRGTHGASSLFSPSLPLKIQQPSGLWRVFPRTGDDNAPERSPVRTHALPCSSLA